MSNYSPRKQDGTPWTIEEIIKQIEQKAGYMLSSAQEHERLEQEHRIKKEVWRDAHHDLFLLLNLLKTQ